jgi:hypothetical protein
MRKKIFVSYRRADTKGYAHAIYNLLVSEFGENNIFMDVDTIHPGEDFVKRLETEINSCDVVLTLIGPNWLDIRDQQGNKRLDDPSDFVRQEIEAALRNDIYIIDIIGNSKIAA